MIHSTEPNYPPPCTILAFSTPLLLQNYPAMLSLILLSSSHQLHCHYYPYSASLYLSQLIAQQLLILQLYPIFIVASPFFHLFPISSCKSPVNLLLLILCFEKPPGHLITITYLFATPDDYFSFSSPTRYEQLCRSSTRTYL